MLVSITPDEMARHLAAIDRIRRRPFRKHVRADYWIMEGIEKDPRSVRLSAGSIKRLAIDGLRCLEGYYATRWGFE